MVPKVSRFNKVTTSVAALMMAASGAFAAVGIQSRAVEAESDYGVCRGTSDKCFNDWRQGYANDGETRVLVYSRTVGPRHAHLGTVLGEGLNPPLNEDNAAQQAMLDWGEEYGFSVDYTEDVNELSSAGRLRPYDAVVFLSTTRDTLDDNAQTALMQYVRGGGGFVGIHNAFGTEYHWKWYEGLIGGTNFYDHGPHQEATVVRESKKDVSTKNLPKTFTSKDEWYNLYPYPSDVRVLLSVDEKSMATKPSDRENGHTGHPKEHPVSWCQYYDGGRAWLTTMGHDVAVWTGADFPGGAEQKEHIVNGILSAAGAETFCK